MLNLEATLPRAELDLAEQIVAVEGTGGAMPPTFQWGKPEEMSGAHHFTKLKNLSADTTESVSLSIPDYCGTISY